MLANLYMRRFILAWKVQGHGGAILDAHIVNYADDFVICTRHGRADEAMVEMRRIMEEIAADGEREEDAAVCSAGRDVPRSWATRSRAVLLAEDGAHAYISPWPSAKKVRKR